jgi:hypothetical protein
MPQPGQNQADVGVHCSLARVRAGATRAQGRPGRGAPRSRVTRNCTAWWKNCLSRRYGVGRRPLHECRRECRGKCRQSAVGSVVEPSYTRQGRPPTLPRSHVPCITVPASRSVLPLSAIRGLGLCSWWSSNVEPYVEPLRQLLRPGPTSPPYVARYTSDRICRDSSDPPSVTLYLYTTSRDNASRPVERGCAPSFREVLERERVHLEPRDKAAEGQPSESEAKEAEHHGQQQT